MAKAKILIIDDDTTVANAISEAFVRAGFDTLIETKGKSALSTLRVEKVDGIVVDCMIPGINGVDLAVKIREEINFNKKIILISGIFKDKKFAESSIKKAAADDFLFKPLDLTQLVDQFDTSEASSGSSSSGWTDVFNQQDFLNETEEFTINRSDLLPIIKELKNKKKTARLLINDYTLTFASGSVVNVEGPDKKSFISKTVISKNYTTEIFVNKYIDDKSEEDICEQLINKSMLSPHLLQILLNEYYLKTINHFLFAEDAESFDIQLEVLSKSKYEKELNLRNEDFIYFDYIENNFNKHVMLYTNLMQNVDYVTHTGLSENPVMSLPFMQTKKTSVDLILNNKNIKNLVDTPSQRENIQVLYFLHIKGLLHIVPASVSDDELASLEKRLTTVLAGIQGQSPQLVFKYLGVEDTRAIFVTTFFKSFAKLNHPDKLPQTASDSLRSLNQDVFSIVSEAHGILTDSTKKEAYDKEMSSKKAEVILKAEKLKEEGQAFLAKSNYKEALPLFIKAREIHLEPMLTLYYYWCYMKVNKKIEDKKERLSIYNELVAFEIEDKRNELYALVMGIFYKRSKKYDDAKDEFEKSLGYNKNFLPARRELMNLKSQLSKSKSNDSILTGDLSTVVSGFFKKKA